jgi:phospholipase C
VIFLMQENHSFDNYFGNYPGADGRPAGTCQPLNPNRPKAGCVAPYPIGKHPIQDLGHSTVIFADQYRGGAMNGFVSGLDANNLNGRQAMGYYDSRDLPFYWNVADNYVLFDHFFTSAAAGSVWNHMFWVTATPGNPTKDEIPVNGFGSLPTIFDRLQAAGLTWKFYVQHYDPKVNYRSGTVGNAGSQIVWNPLLDYSRYIHNPKLFSHIVDIEQYFEDLQNGTLPDVAFMVPAGSSEHPPGSIQSGQRYVRAIINALMRSSDWSSSSFMWSYDDWGGWFDHVKPPRVDRYGYGFRAPALLVSAYAKKGFVDHTTLDFTSELAFIEHNWHLTPLAKRDAAALRQGRDLMNAFDFTKGPRTAVFLQGQRTPPKPDNTRRWVVYVLYGGSMVLSGLVLGWAAVRTVRRRPGGPWWRRRQGADV